MVNEGTQQDTFDKDSHFHLPICPLFDKKNFFKSLVLWAPVKGVPPAPRTRHYLILSISASFRAPPNWLPTPLPDAGRNGQDSNNRVNPWAVSDSVWISSGEQEVQDIAQSEGEAEAERMAPAPLSRCGPTPVSS